MSPDKQLTDVIRTWSEVFMRRSMADFKHFMAETGLSFPQINVLIRLFHSHHCSVSDIGTQLGVSNAAASQLVHGLVQMGYVGREEDPQDRRAKRLSLTSAGVVLMEQGIGARSRWLEDLAEALTPEQQQMIITALTLLTEAARATGR